ncbi:MAG: phosphatidylglycerol---prolipoprotein diacylglyceryl transferase [Abditibacteriota bacterium]|nr:phosphatidylglycerol---prolipoprotein diacylglyceryl transferase [Abditibacteriota bacterium]
MLPILANIPPLPQSWLWPLCALALLGAIGTSVMWSRAPLQAETTAGANSDAQPAANDATSKLQAALAPIAFALMACVMLWVWSRNPIKIHAYGLMLIVGFLGATWMSCAEARRRGHDPNLIIDLAMPLLLVTIACCRVLYIILNHEQFSSPAEWIRLWDGGLSFHGAIVGAVMVLAYYGWRSKLGFWRLGDIIAPSVFFGYAWGRFGCFLNGCCYGGPCDMPWAVVFPVEGARHQLTPPSHPAQLYSALAAIGLFFWMQRAKTQPRFNRFAGQLTLLFLALYAIERFVIEIFRNGATARTVFGTDWLTQAQVASVLGLLAIVALWLWKSRTSTGDTESHTSNPDAVSAR